MTEQARIKDLKQQKLSEKAQEAAEKERMDKARRILILQNNIQSQVRKQSASRRVEERIQSESQLVKREKQLIQRMNRQTQESSVNSNQVKVSELQTRKLIRKQKQLIHGKMQQAEHSNWKAEKLKSQIQDLLRQKERINELESKEQSLLESYKNTESEYSRLSQMTRINSS